SIATARETANGRSAHRVRSPERPRNIPSLPVRILTSGAVETGLSSTTLRWAPALRFGVWRKKLTACSQHSPLARTDTPPSKPVWAARSTASLISKDRPKSSAFMINFFDEFIEGLGPSHRVFHHLAQYTGNYPWSRKRR